ncbi:MAG: hypothetical protein H6737_22010 [Alphaproteobacteria bacterium]|nr:hypothetical protein [Alphaproteobacteria bacterium]
MKLSPSARCLGFLALVACSGGTPEDTDPPPPTPCGATPPTVANAVIVDNGPMDFGGQVWPSLRITFDAADADGALTAYRILVGFDDDIDQIVDLTDPIVAENDFGPHDCSISEAELFIDIAVNGEPESGIVTEFALVLEDSDGQQSDPPVILQITTP